MVKELKLNEPFSKYQGLTNSLFEEKGHPTTRTDPSTENGYVHSIGHGLGLHVHEVPFSGKGATPDDILAAGSVFTIEPGLYYPDKGMGVRLEDTFWMDQNGIANKFVEYPMDFILPIRTVD